MAARSFDRHDILTEEEMSQFVLDKLIMKKILQHQEEMMLDNAEFNILDWGCGKGNAVAYLRKKGYNAFGVEVDKEMLQNGRSLFLRRALNPDDLLSLLGPGGKTKFPDGYFHFVYSYQVLEHTNDIGLIASEINRITIDSGAGLHCYPARFCVIEPHLFMPLIHWAPKNNLRKQLILLFPGCAWIHRWLLCHCQCIDAHVLQAEPDHHLHLPRAAAGILVL